MATLSEKTVMSLAILSAATAAKNVIEALKAWTELKASEHASGLELLLELTTIVGIPRVLVVFQALDNAGPALLAELRSRAGKVITYKNTSGNESLVSPNAAEPFLAIKGKRSPTEQRSDTLETDKPMQMLESDASVTTTTKNAASPETNWKTAFGMIYKQVAPKLIDRLDSFHPHFTSTVLNHTYGTMVMRGWFRVEHIALFFAFAILPQDAKKQLYSQIRGSLINGMSAKFIKTLFKELLLRNIISLTKYIDGLNCLLEIKSATTKDGSLASKL